MNIQVNTDDTIQGGEGMTSHVNAVVESTLRHMAERVTRVEVHLSDKNSKKGGSADKCCVMEARLEGCQPIAVTDDAETIAQAIDGAAEKLKSSLDSTLSRLRTHR